MARPRTLPDSEVYSVILALIAAEGEKSVAFSAVSRATGLAGASLVQRYGSLAKMVEAALDWGWDELDKMAVHAQDTVDASGAKGVQLFLKALTHAVQTLPLAALLAASLRHARLRPRAAAWKRAVEDVIADQLHDRDAALMVFAGWQGQVLWEGVETKGFRLKDLLKRLD